MRPLILCACIAFLRFCLGSCGPLTLRCVIVRALRASVELKTHLVILHASVQCSMLYCTNAVFARRPRILRVWTLFVASPRYRPYSSIVRITLHHRAEVLETAVSMCIVILHCFHVVMACFGPPTDPQQAVPRSHGRCGRGCSSGRRCSGVGGWRNGGEKMAID